MVQVLFYGKYLNLIFKYILQEYICMLGSKG